MYQDHQGLPRRFYKEQCKEGEEGADKKALENNIAEWTGLKVCRIFFCLRSNLSIDNITSAQSQV